MPGWLRPAGRNQDLTIQCSLVFGTRAEGDQWIGWCPSLRISSVGDTRAEAYAAVNEAATLWINSCVARGTLEDALRELEFVRCASPMTHDVFRVEGETYWRFPDYLPSEDLARLVRRLPDPAPGPAGADLAPFDYQPHEPQALHT